MDETLPRLEEELVRRDRDLGELDADAQYRLLAAKSKLILPEDVVLDRLRRSKATGKPLIVKLGIDPTGTDLHLGHAVPLFLLRRFQDLGHRVILLVGDFTAQIGDPAGRVEERPPLTRDQIERNFATYREQAGRIIDLERVEVRHNSEWLDGVRLPDLLRTLKGVNVSASLQRDDFRDRIEKGYSLTLAEVLYSVLMGLDSVALVPDIEIGGVDQLLNLQMCRQIMEIEGQPPEGIVVTEILEGISGDGAKMSKSLGNAIALDDPPEEMFGKLMSIPDATMESYFQLLTEIRQADWQALSSGMGSGELNPRDVKALLARVLISILHGRAAAKEAESHFESIFRQGRFPDEIPSHRIATDRWAGCSLVSMLHDSSIVSSRSEGRRLLAQGALRYVVAAEEGDFSRIEEDRLPGAPREIVVKVGRRKFLRVIPT